MSKFPVRVVTAAEITFFEVDCDVKVKQGYRVTFTSYVDGVYRAIFILPEATLIPQLTRLLELPAPAQDTELFRGMGYATSKPGTEEARQ